VAEIERGAGTQFDPVGVRLPARGADQL